MKRVLIIGAGSAGQMVASEILNKKDISRKYTIAGFLDDRGDNSPVMGLPILGKIYDAPSVIMNNAIDEVIIAIPSAGKEVIQRILAVLSLTQTPVRIVPGIFEIIEGKVQYSQIRDIQPSDLLGREEVGLDLDRISPFYKGKTVLVTGAGGSIGREIFLHLLKLPIKRAVAFGHGENSIHSLIVSQSNDDRFEYCIGDIKDIQKLLHEFSRFKPDIVFHAAAHKHLPLMEEYPDEAVKTNIIGTYYTALASIQSGVRDFVFVSTDKAVNPSSVMGATKRVAEKIVLSFNEMQDVTRFCITRFGNVLGSRGSVIPVFTEQIEKGGPITITHPEITRYFMSIPEAARLVIKAATVPDGKIFVMDMGRPIRILDLAKNLLKIYGYSEQDIPIIFTGLRKGEKMHEELTYSRDALKISGYDRLFISGEDFKFLRRDDIKSMITELSESAENFNASSILPALRKYIPEYTDQAPM
jgi:FlaA1/EpsC-like NDP-sugar epimerase